MVRGYQLKLYPSPAQAELINKTIGCSRFIYNYYLNDIIKNKTDTCLSKVKEIPNLCLSFPWLKEVDGGSLRISLFNLENNLKRWKKGIAGFPKIKTKDFGNSYTTNNFMTYKGKEAIRIDFKNKILTLPKLGDVPFRGYHKKTSFSGKIKSAVIKKEAGKYYASLLVEEEISLPEFQARTIVGIDLGIKDLIVTSYNEKIENSLDCLKVKKRIKGLQKALARCQPGSKNRYKIKLKLQRAYMKLKNIRKHQIHAITNKIIAENDIIVMEDLDVKGMYQTHSFAKRLTNIPFAEIKQVLEYKCKWKNKKLITIDRYYPSSQICSTCGYQNKKLKDLSIRNWECPHCKTVHDRDFNASVNIMFEGLKKYILNPQK